jgi:hypothetical protein
LSAFVYKCAESNLELGAKLLMCITPRVADIAVRREVDVRTISDLDASLIARGLPPSKEIFQISYGSSDEDITEGELDYRGSDPIEAEEAEVIDRKND